MNLKKLFSIIGLLVMTTSIAAQKPIEMNIWPDGAPNDNGNPADSAKIKVFLPKKEKATGRAIVICPGGGYSKLAMEHEGTDWAGYFNNMGIAAIVLKYRMPNGNHNVPVSDAEEALKLVRHNATAWNIRTDDIGIMGFSAGGHLASTIATHSQGVSKPDFQILFYPVISMTLDITHRGSHDNFLGNKPKKKMEIEYSNDVQVNRTTPRAWIALSDDDRVVLPANGLNYYTELYRHDVPASLHIYPEGGHGWGMRSSFKFHVEMLLELKAWLEAL